MIPEYWDTHVHLDFMQNPGEIAETAEAIGLGLFAMTVTPLGYLQLCRSIKETEHVKLFAGLHPWWIADGRCSLDDAKQLAELAEQARFIGEIGLDASPRHVPEGSQEIQAEAFEMICSSAAQNSDPQTPKILSIHAVQAVGLALDILERTGCLENCKCIFHWFTGSGDELNRAVKAKCMFSINEMMLRTRRGREYARQIPPGRLLLETDLPPGENVPFSTREIWDELDRTSNILQQIRHTDTREVLRKNTLKMIAG